jgi:hypothetical protein
MAFERDLEIFFMKRALVFLSDKASNVNREKYFLEGLGDKSETSVETAAGLLWRKVWLHSVSSPVQWALTCTAV